MTNGGPTSPAPSGSTPMEAEQSMTSSSNLLSAFALQQSMEDTHTSNTHNMSSGTTRTDNTPVQQGRLQYMG